MLFFLVVIAFFVDQNNVVMAVLCNLLIEVHYAIIRLFNVMSKVCFVLIEFSFRPIREIAFWIAEGLFKCNPFPYFLVSKNLRNGVFTELFAISKDRITACTSL